MKSTLTAIAILLTVVATDASGRKHNTTEPDISTIKTQQQQTKREIKETNRQISVNRKETEAKLRQLNTLRRSAADNRTRIDELQKSVDTVNRHIAMLSDSIDLEAKRIETLRASYVESLRRMQGDRRSTSRFAFIFSAHSFREAWRRMRYLGEFSEWREEKTGQINTHVADLQTRKANLAVLKQQRQSNLDELAGTNAILEKQQDEAATLVASLQAKGSELQAVLREKEQKARELNATLSRLIAAEQERLERQRREQRQAEQKREQERIARERREQEKQKAATASPSPARNSDKDSQQRRQSENSHVRKPEPENIAAADRTLSGSFTSNKGRLLFPVSGSYRITRDYGRRPHPDMRNVYTENNGIDIEVKAGTKARAVFDGKVVSILQVGGYNTVVMLRHGDYYTVYTNLVDLAVSPGQDVTTGQTLGTVWSDPDEGNHGVIHFELRRLRQTLNPHEWVR